MDTNITAENTRNDDDEPEVMQDNPHDLPIEHSEHQNGSNMQIFDDKGFTNKSNRDQSQKYNF